ncbi:uncharacterized protein DNG_00119 [Cephalotrichum gorgonifer]|uniref:Uncharacterized protein n=1 Tax=Cephalotrichum gorgonifer TaxID=2041049 RepID=A0AAE8MNC2_9PEZI|nr:uncharacterized protein DNG_00119 [Cephalotrichum gorgonifer]
MSNTPPSPPTHLSLPNGTNPTSELKYRMDTFFGSELPASDRLAVPTVDDEGSAGGNGTTGERLQRLKDNIEEWVEVIQKGGNSGSGPGR